MACDVMSIGKILIGNFENKISDNKKRLIEKIISKKHWIG